jgi:hypothetical protein
LAPGWQPILGAINVRIANGGTDCHRAQNQSNRHRHNLKSRGLSLLWVWRVVETEWWILKKSGNSLERFKTTTRMASLDHDHFATERRRVKEAFEFFDREGRGLLVKEEIGTIMRYLGAFPSEEDIIKNILPQVCNLLF